MPKFSDSRDRLIVLSRVGNDPGSVRADTCIPKDFQKSGPLVVLHGSSQSLQSYDLGSG